MLPIVDMLPPETPFTSQVTVVDGDVVEFSRLTVAVNSVWVLIGTLTEEGVIDTDVTVVGLLPLQPCMPKAPTIASARIASGETLS